MMIYGGIVATALFALALGLVLPGIAAWLCAPPTETIEVVLDKPAGDLPVAVQSSAGRSLFDPESHNGEDVL